MATPLRACLDFAHASNEGGRIVVARDWLQAQRLPSRNISEAIVALAAHRTYRSPDGAWSLTPLES